MAIQYVFSPRVLFVISLRPRPIEVVLTNDLTNLAPKLSMHRR